MPDAQQVPPQTGAPAAQQTPAVQAPVPQDTPQAPQFRGSVSVFTQVPPQLTVPVAQQRPSEQPWPVAQAWPHVPQFARSVCVSTHAPEHAVCPAGQRQLPEVQVAPVAQAWPHEPQLPSSLARSAQTVGFTASGHSVPAQVQVEVAQVSPGRQERSQAPQFRGSDSVFRHCGLEVQSVEAGVPLQLHAPAEQVASAAATPGPRQAKPQAPQFAASVRVSTQRPPHEVGAAAGQAHWPAAQTPPAAQWRVHTPQLFGSEARSTHIPLQRVWPDGHASLDEEQPPSASAARAQARAVGRAVRQGCGTGREASGPDGTPAGGAASACSD